ncbi:kelch-like protein 10 [Mya arenaria]|uniref:kelch-like protein 10 n=1 Tax=Mya arenaria TaxID=6604 RepID=UPI0022E893F4|nr:kelch-like protein 10 [Mya arenaria]XP_052812772.1 kelch-like protein 10 [Mya arenaria]
MATGKIEWHDSSSDENIDQKYSLNSCNILNELRKSGQLTDAVIVVEHHKFPIHRAIMSACSPYFRALFTNELFNTDRKEVVIPGVSAEAMKIIIDYAYTRRIDVCPDNVELLLPAADQFHVNGMVKACCDYLAAEMTAENCIGIYKFAKTYFCHQLERTAARFLMQNFITISKDSNEFLQLTCEELAEVLSRDELNVKNEEIVFDAVLRWIDYDPERRKSSIAKLMRAIRLGLLTTQYFVEKVKPHPYVRESEGCKPIVIETLKFLYDLDMDEDRAVDVSNPLARPRVPHELLFVVGGWSGGSPTNIVETYDTRADRWIVCEAMDHGPRAYHGTVCLGHKIYIIGGFDGMDYFNSVRCFDPVLKDWSEVAPMNAKRCYVSTTSMDGLIYAMGGYDGHNRQNTAERFQPSSNQWSLIQPMNHQRSDASATTLNKRVYICGGFNGQECLHNAEYYDPNTNQWTMIAPMRNRRSGVGIIAYRDSIFAMGGFNGISRMNTAERYNPLTNSWNALPDMFSPRSNFAIEVLDDMIFVIGGFNGMTTIFNVECYDGTVDEWYDASDMNLYRSALSACVITGLPNVHEYINGNRERESGRRSRAQTSHE